MGSGPGVVKTPKDKGHPSLQDGFTDSHDRWSVCWGGVQGILNITQLRVRPKITGFQQVSKSKQMGPTFWNTEAVGGPSPGEVPQTSSVSMGIYSGTKLSLVL